jgi:hypothetical protein
MKSIFPCRVTLGNLNDFLSTSCITNLSFLGSQEDGLPDRKYIIFNKMFVNKIYKYLRYNKHVKFLITYASDVAPEDGLKQIEG